MLCITCGAGAGGVSNSLCVDDALVHTPTRAACAPPSMAMDESLFAPGSSTILRWMREKPRRRVAVAFSGMFRNNEPGNIRDTMRRTMASYRMHLELVNPDYEVDFFFHVYVHTPAAELDVRSVEHIRTFPNVRALVVEVFTQEIMDGLIAKYGEKPFSQFLRGFDKSTDCPRDSHADSWTAPLPYNCGELYNFELLSSMRKMYLANELVTQYARSNDVNYEFVIRARLDRFLGADLLLQQLPKDKITTPLAQGDGDKDSDPFYAWPNWMEDQFAVGPPKLMDRYTSLFVRVEGMYADTNRLFEHNKTAWLSGRCTNISNPVFCQQWMEPRLFSDAEVNTITFPVRCWASAHNYTEAEMASWLQPSKINGCGRSGSEGHKIVLADLPTIKWNEASCSFNIDAPYQQPVAPHQYQSPSAFASEALVASCGLAIFVAYNVVLGPLSNRKLPPTAFAFVALSLLATQATLLVRWSRDASGRLPYDSATAVLTTEAVKLLVAFLSWSRSRGTSAYDGLAGISPTRVLTFCVPGLLYAFQNNIVFAALTYLDGPTFNIFSSFKLITTAILHRVVLQSHKTEAQWIGLLLLFLAMATTHATTGLTTSSGASDFALGVMLVLLNSMLSGCSNVMNEWLVKRQDPDAPLMFKNMQLYAWGVVINTIILFAFQADDDHPPFAGFSLLQFWLVVLTNAGVGLTISIIMKLSSALTNCFAKSVDVFLTAAISSATGDFEFSVQFALGLAIYLASNVLYFRDGKQLVAKRPIETDAPPLQFELLSRGAVGAELRGAE